MQDDHQATLQDFHGSWVITLPEKIGLPGVMLLFALVATVISEVLTFLFYLAWSPMTEAGIFVLAAVIPALTAPAMAVGSVRLIHQLTTAMNALNEEITLRRNTESELYRLATVDELTALCNRRFFHNRLHEVIAQTLREPERPVSLVSFDLDYFKRVNDAFGHAAGDIVLKAVATACSSNVRPGDTLARVGGEEFALLLPNTGPQAAMVCAERLREAIARQKTVVTEGQPPLQITASFGIATYKPHESAEVLMQRADRAMYSAKGAGRNICLFSSDAPLISQEA